jgi:hypothetical protein
VASGVGAEVAVEREVHATTFARFKLGGKNGADYSARA